MAASVFAKLPKHIVRMVLGLQIYGQSSPSGRIPRPWTVEEVMILTGIMREMYVWKRMLGRMEMHRRVVIPELEEWAFVYVARVAKGLNLRYSSQSCCNACRGPRGPKASARAKAMEPDEGLGSG